MLAQSFRQPTLFSSRRFRNFSRTIFAQTFTQPTLFSTNRVRDPSSRNLCPNLPSTSAVLNQSLSKPLLAQVLLKPSLNQRCFNQSLLKPFLEQSLLRPSLNQRSSQPVAFETLSHTIFAQTFLQPALFSTGHSRNPCSHKVCSNLPSTTASQTNPSSHTFSAEAPRAHSLLKPSLPQALLRAFLNHPFSKQPPLTQILC